MSDLEKMVNSNLEEGEDWLENLFRSSSKTTPRRRVVYKGTEYGDKTVDRKRTARLAQLDSARNLDEAEALANEAVVNGIEGINPNELSDVNWQKVAEVEAEYENYEMQQVLGDDYDTVESNHNVGRNSSREDDSYILREGGHPYRNIDKSKKFWLVFGKRF